jgi:hypothetical protein
LSLSDPELLSRLTVLGVLIGSAKDDVVQASLHDMINVILRHVHYDSKLALSSACLTLIGSLLLRPSHVTDNETRNSLIAALMSSLTDMRAMELRILALKVLGQLGTSQTKVIVRYPHLPSRSYLFPNLLRCRVNHPNR